MTKVAATSRAVIGLGSNLRPRATLAAALARLADMLGALTWSSTYASPCRVDGSHRYWNLVAVGTTPLGRDGLERQLDRIESELGRRRGPEAAGEVAIDLDLLLLDGGPGSAPEYVRPAAAMLEAAHVRVPLAELLPGWRHPDADDTLAELARSRPADDLTLVAGRDCAWLGAATGSTPA